MFIIIWFLKGFIFNFRVVGFGSFSNSTRSFCYPLRDSKFYNSQLIKPFNLDPSEVREAAFSFELEINFLKRFWEGVRLADLIHPMTLGISKN